MAQTLTLRAVTEPSLTTSDVVNGNIFVSPEQTNTFQSFVYRAAKISLTYDNLVSDNSAHFQAVIEGKSDDGSWHPIAYQFDPFRFSGFKQDRVIIIDPDLFWPDAGISNIIYVAGQTIAEISPQQVALPETWRLCIKTLNAVSPNFTSIDVSITAELYSPQ